MPTSYNLRIEVSGLCMFVVFQNEEVEGVMRNGLHALLLSEHGHEPSFMVHQYFAPSSSCNPKDDDGCEGEKYRMFSVSRTIDWPASVHQEVQMDLPANLINLSAVTGESVRRTHLMPNPVRAIVPLNFGQPQSVLLPGRFNRYREADGSVDPTMEQLCYKVVFDTIVDAGPLELELGPACTLRLQANEDLEIRIKSMPKNLRQGRDPRPGDAGDPTHFTGLYETLENSPKDRIYPIPNGFDPSPALKIKSSLYTCMPGGGS